MGNIIASTASPLEQCLTAVCNGRDNCAGFPSDPLFQIGWVMAGNPDVPVTPTAVVRPETAQDVAAFVTCAVTSGVKVQAKSGGHSYGNYGLGGEDGELAIDLVNLKQFLMNETTWRATIGAGNRLSDVTEKLHQHGGRAISHGTCPGVGIGGHATIGGLGPSSRMWGSSLDHVVEVEVVTADGEIRRASETEHPELFFALKGAGAGFGIITEFVMRTNPEPGEVVQYSYSHTFGRHADAAAVFSTWQALVSDPDLDRRFSTEIILHALGAIVSTTFYGTEAEFVATGIPARLPSDAAPLAVFTSGWLGAVEHQTQTAGMGATDVPVPFTAKSLAFRPQDLLSESAVADLMTYLDDTDSGTPLWFLIFDATGGAINDVPANATAYSHRDKLMFCQGYGVGIPAVTPQTRDFLAGIIDTIKHSVPTGAELSTYPGYVDRDLDGAQESYWGPNLPALQAVKTKWDPLDVFHNPQSVRPGDY